MWLGEEKQRNSVLQTPRVISSSFKEQTVLYRFSKWFIQLCSAALVRLTFALCCTSSNQILQGSLVFEKGGGAWESLEGKKKKIPTPLMSLYRFFSPPR